MKQLLANEHIVCTDCCLIQSSSGFSCFSVCVCVSRYSSGFLESYISLMVVVSAQHTIDIDFIFLLNESG